uniref:Uncharacterized protein n=1 Tax=Micrurus spixii TaxID=129469 RepID=A0A2D4NIR7_9SAUR
MLLFPACFLPSGAEQNGFEGIVFAQKILLLGYNSVATSTSLLLPHLVSNYIVCRHIQLSNQELGGKESSNHCPAIHIKLWPAICLAPLLKVGSGGVWFFLHCHPFFHFQGQQECEDGAVWINQE